jgi:hypothetical protein
MPIADARIAQKPQFLLHNPSSNGGAVITLHSYLNPGDITGTLKSIRGSGSITVKA